MYCPKCNYDLQGQVELRCPECGEPCDQRSYLLNLPAQQEPVILCLKFLGLPAVFAVLTPLAIAGGQLAGVAVLMISFAFGAAFLARYVAECVRDNYVVRTLLAGRPRPGFMTGLLAIGLWVGQMILASVSLLFWLLLQNA